MRKAASDDVSDGRFTFHFRRRSGLDRQRTNPSTETAISITSASSTRTQRRAHSDPFLEAGSRCLGDMSGLDLRSGAIEKTLDFRRPMPLPLRVPASTQSAGARSRRRVPAWEAAAPCGARDARPDDPASPYPAIATRRSRGQAGGSGSGSPNRQRRSVIPLRTRISSLRRRGFPWSDHAPAVVAVAALVPHTIAPGCGSSSPPGPNPLLDGEIPSAGHAGVGRGSRAGDCVDQRSRPIAIG